MCVCVYVGHSHLCVRVSVCIYVQCNLYIHVCKESVVIEIYVSQLFSAFEVLNYPGIDVKRLVHAFPEHFSLIEKDHSLSRRLEIEGMYTYYILFSYID